MTPDGIDPEVEFKHFSSAFTVGYRENYKPSSISLSISQLKS